MLQVRASLKGRTFLNAMACDNLDFEVKAPQPTVEHAHANLVHLTTATVIPVHPETTLEDLDCADEVWRYSPYNMEGDRSRSNIPLIKLMKIHEERDPLPPDNLTRRQRFNKWKFMHDLVHHVPQYFKKFKSAVGKPNTVEAIPMAKTFQIPMRAMDISASTPATNANVLESMRQQAGIGDPN